MSDKQKIEATDEAWDSGQLGQDKEHVRVSVGVDEKSIDETAGLVPVSIRLQKSLVADFKMIARLIGIGYQPLMRQILTRFAEGEKKKIIRDMLTEEGIAFDLDHEPDTDRARRTRLTMKYLAIVEKSDNGYGAYVSDLPGWVAAAKTRNEVVALIQEAIEFHI